MSWGRQQSQVVVEERAGHVVLQVGVERDRALVAADNDAASSRDTRDELEVGTLLLLDCSKVVEVQVEHVECTDSHPNSRRLLFLRQSSSSLRMKRLRERGWPSSVQPKSSGRNRSQEVYTSLFVAPYQLYLCKLADSLQPNTLAPLLDYTTSLPAPPTSHRERFLRRARTGSPVG